MGLLSCPMSIPNIWLLYWTYLVEIKIIDYGYSFCHQIFNVHLNPMGWGGNQIFVGIVIRLGRHFVDIITGHPIFVGSAIELGWHITNIQLASLLVSLTGHPILMGGPVQSSRHDCKPVVAYNELKSNIPELTASSADTMQCWLVLSYRQTYI
jgi:hypothetical protein